MAPAPARTTAPAGHAEMANAIRALAMDAVEQAKSGHPGMPMGMADVATVLFTRFLRFDAAAPGWPNRDRFVLSAGHGSMLLYALLYLTGYPGMDLDQLRAADLVLLDRAADLAYLFKHVATQEVAYESLPYATRSMLHGRVGSYLEASDPAGVEHRLDLLQDLGVLRRLALHPVEASGKR